MTHKHTQIKFTPYIFICFFSCILLNVAGNSITNALHAPVWLNSVGTLICSCLIGPVSGSITGIIGTILCHIDSPILWTYSITCIPIAVSISFLYKKTKLHNTFQLLCSSILIMMFSTFLSVPLNMLFRNGYIGNRWGDALVDMLLQNGNESLYSCVLGQLFVELPDKVLVVFISFLIIKLVHITKNRRRGVKK